MSRGLGHNPAQTTELPALQRQQILPDAKASAPDIFSLASLPGASSGAFAGLLDSVHASVPSPAVGTARQGRQAAQEPSGRGGLGSGGATVPRSGIGGPSLPRPEGSSSVKRWSLLGRIQKLCRPADLAERGPAVCGCGRPGYDATSVNVHLRCDETTGEFRAGVSGVYRCGSPWLCPVCAVWKALERAEKIEGVAKATFGRGGQVGLLVLTASHSKGMSLTDVKKLVQDASSKARKGRAWIDAQDEYGIMGVVVGQEVTYSRVNGWHYHQHLCIPVDGPTDEEKALAGESVALLETLVRERAEKAARWLATAYKNQIRAKGGKVSDRHGCRVRVADDWEDASGYTAKGSMAWEVSGGHKDVTKAASSMTPWDIATAAADGDAFMVHRWREYVDVMPGTRTCVVSAALAKKLDISASEIEEGEQELHERDDIVGRVEAPVWKRWMRFGLAATFLSRVEYGGAEGFADAVDATERDADTVAARRVDEEDTLRSIVEEVFCGATVVRLDCKRADDRIPFETAEQAIREAKMRAVRESDRRQRLAPSDGRPRVLDCREAA